MIVVKANVLYDGKTKLENRFIVIEDDKIVKITEEEMKADYEGYVTPAFIDAHSHIGMFREGEPGGEAEGNDKSSQFLPLLNPLNSVYFDDRAFSDSVDFGVLYCCIVPGSGNLIGGQAKIIKNYAANTKDALLKDYGYKMALGFNPRSTTMWKGERPNTRMGVYAMLENKFDSLIMKKERMEIVRDKKLRDLDKKMADKENKMTSEEYDLENSDITRSYELEFTAEDKAILEILAGEKTVKIHVHKEDDVLYLIKLVKKYGIKCTADHTCDVWHQEIYEELAKNNIPVVFGPIGGIAEKIELAHAYYQNVELLMKSKVEFGLMTDHPVVWGPALRDSLKFFMIQGMSEEEAISTITYKNAKILGIDDILGTVEENKLASIIVWDKNPLTFAAFPKAVIGEGKVLREKK